MNNSPGNPAMSRCLYHAVEFQVNHFFILNIICLLMLYIIFYVIPRGVDACISLLTKHLGIACPPIT